MQEDKVLIDNVSYTYEEESVPALTDISLSIKPGEFVAVLGHNGSGKSTLAKLINALYLPTSGKVVVCGMDTADDDKIWEIRQQAGMIFQNPDNQLVATIVKDDVAFGLENLGVPRDEMIPRIESALSQVRMNSYGDAAPHTLSGGQKQRIAIAGILAMEPSVIIADEATAMLDPSGRKEVLDTIMQLNRMKGITVCWITHFMEEAALADRIIVVDSGKVAMTGKPAEVFQHVEKLRSLHLDVPRMTELSRSLQDSGVPLPNGILTVNEMADQLTALLSGKADCPKE